MQRFLGLVVDKDGVPMSGVTVTVKKAGTGTNATLYSDNVYTAKTNGFSNDSDGTYEFYAPNGRIDIIYTKGGKTFTDTNSADVILYDPADDSAAVIFRNEFMAPFLSGSDVIVDGNHWRVGGGLVGQESGTSTYRNGWIKVVETGGVAGLLNLVETTNSFALLWVPSTDIIVLDLRPEKVGTAVAGTRRIGMADSALSSAPVNGIYVEQIDASNAFLVCRAASSGATQDLGVTLTAMKKIRVVITTSSVRAIVDDAAKTAITTFIPTAILGASIYGGATGSAAGIRSDYFNVYTGGRV